MENLNGVELKCKQGFTLTAGEGVIIATKRGQAERFPISQMQSVKFRLGKLFDTGVITFKIGSNTASLNVGMGFGLGLGGEKIFMFPEGENEIAQKFYDYICYCQAHPMGTAQAPATQEANTVSSVVAVADEIRALKGLLEDGIITQEDFDAKKKQLLGI